MGKAERERIAEDLGKRGVAQIPRRAHVERGTPPDVILSMTLTYAVL